MGWSLGFDSVHNRDIGYGVPAYCDHPGCGREIDRGLSYVCGGDMYGGDHGCGLFFCEDHLLYYNKRWSDTIISVPLCYRCGHYRSEYKPTHDHPDWLRWKLRDAGWMRWRKDNPAEVEKIRTRLWADAQLKTIEAGLIQAGAEM